MTRKALTNVLFHKSEVTYRETGVSKNLLVGLKLNNVFFYIVNNTRGNLTNLEKLQPP